MTTIQMALYLVVHHRQDPHQPWPNSWLDDNRLEVITTTSQIGQLCQIEQSNKNDVFVHRCGFGSNQPTVSCVVKVADVQPIDRKTSLVRFENQRMSGLATPQTPALGTNYYVV